MANESDLMRICAPLYGSFALESFWTLILATFFTYLSVLISSKQQLKNPGGAVLRFLWYHFSEWVNDTHRILKRWDTMHECDMGQRFRYCRRLNATICRIQVAAALMSMTRWLHINNINGFRYLGYSFTCPLMQAEMILLIAPAVPCYKCQMFLTMIITNIVMLTGWYASTIPGDLWTTDWEDVFKQGNLHNLTDKGMWVFPSMAGVLFLCSVQVPYLALLYNTSRKEMPQGFNKMLLLTGVSWLGFPIWWFLSYEGASIISDTKLNGLGFTLLNVISKGGFTLTMIGMVKTFKRKKAAETAAAAAAAGVMRPRSGSVGSVESLPPLPGDAPEPKVQRQERSLPTGQSLVWMIQAMKPFDEDGDGVPPPPSTGEKDGQPLAPVQSAKELTNEELVNEILRRTDMSPAERSKLASKDGFGHHAVGNKFGGKQSHEKSLDAEIQNACLRFVDEEDSD